MRRILLLSCLAAAPLLTAEEFSAQTSATASQPGLLFYLSADRGTVADFSAGGTPRPTYQAEIAAIPDGARGGALECGDTQLLAYRAPGNIFAQRGTLSFFWRSRYPVGPTPFPIFRVGYADHSSWDMVWLRIDYNGHGFDAFVTDASLARTRVSVPVDPFPAPKTWTHIAFAWDETRGVRLYLDGRLAAFVDTTARYDAALDQFGPHSRIISPYQVQSDYNFVRGGDIDEVRIYDRMLDATAITAIAKNETPAIATTPTRSLADPATRAEWDFRYGFNQPDNPPPPLPDAPVVSIRKVEIHDVYDLKRWWWKATDGIRETTWPGVYNRSRLPGRNDYFQLPDWDCYVDSGKAVTFVLPDEPVNQIEVAGAAWGRMELLPAQTNIENASVAPAESVLFERPKAQEKTVHRLPQPIRGRQVRFTNAEPEDPIGELSAYYVSTGGPPEQGYRKIYRLAPIAGADDSRVSPLLSFIAGRHPPDERDTLIALPADPFGLAPVPPSQPALPLVHVLVPNTWDDRTDGLDGISIDLPALSVAPLAGDRVPLNIQVKDPLWPLRNMMDVTVSVPSARPQILWLDLRDRLLPPGKPLYLTIAAPAGSDFNSSRLTANARVALVFKPREAARAEHELDRFTQARDSYAMLVEEHPNNPRLDLWNRFKGDLDDLLRVNPDHVLGRQYAAAGAGGPRPAFVHAEPPAGVPLWAFRQTELLGRVKRFVNWYIDHRQSAFGDLGGGISDDTDLTNVWPGIALLGADPDKIQRSLQRLLDAAYRNGMFTNGLPTIQADELHSYEEGINCLAQNLILDYGSPRQLERAMATARGIATITGVNSAGHRHIRSSYYSGTKMAEDAPWGVAKPYSYLVLQVPQLLVEYNGSPAARKYLLELADGLAAHLRPGPAGRQVLPGSIEFATDHEGDSTRGIFPWHMFWGAWKWTGDRRYLAPILSGGLTTLTPVNANALDLLSLRADWSERLNIGERAEPNETRRPDGRPRSAEAGFRASSVEHFAWQLDGDKRRLATLYGAQIEQCALLEYINTEGSLWIDRVGVPIAELQRARLGGIALVRNGLFPGHVASWRFAAPATDQSVAILIPDATETAFRVIAYNLENSPVRATLTGWNVAPGTWEIAQGLDTNNNDAIDGPPAVRREVFERSRSVDVTLPPRATTVLTFKLISPGTPYWDRPDLGIDRSDVTINGGRLRVRVHSLGARATPPTTLAVRDSAGRTLATASVPTLAAPDDLLPKTVDVDLEVPAATTLENAVLELDSEHRLAEITLRNNTVKL
jgi:hypothetical protein